MGGITTETITIIRYLSLLRLCLSRGSSGLIRETAQAARLSLLSGIDRTRDFCDWNLDWNLLSATWPHAPSKVYHSLFESHVPTPWSSSMSSLYPPNQMPEFQSSMSLRTTDTHNLTLLPVTAHSLPSPMRRLRIRTLLRPVICSGRLTSIQLTPNRFFTAIRPTQN